MRFLLTTILALSLWNLKAQDNFIVSDTTSFKKVFELTISTDPFDSTQLQYAASFLDYYLNHPDKKYADWSLGTAFKIWGNFGAVELAHNAMNQIPKDEEMWSYFIEFIPSTYFNNPAKSQEDVIQLLENLSTELTHPLAISRVYWLLSIQYNAIDEQDRLLEISQKMINLNAIPAHVEIGLAHIRSLDSLQVGQQAPSFLMQSLIGTQIEVPSEKLILLDFWATWCGPCVAEIPTLKKISARFSSDKVEIIGIAWDHDLEVLNTFLQENKISWPQILQNEKVSTALVQKFGVIGVPSTFLIDPEGFIIAKDVRGEELISEIERLLN